MEAIVQSGPISRASIAKQTGLSKQTISEIVRQLEQEGWVQETGRTSGHVGRTAVTYEFVLDAAYIVAVDLGGTKVRVALTDLACQIFAEDTAPTDPRGGQFIIDQIVAHDLPGRRRGSALPRKKIRLAVIGVPGAPEPDDRPRPAGAEYCRLRQDGRRRRPSRRAFGFDVMLENDVNLAVLGESWLGRGQGIDNLAYIALGTGIGSGLMVGGHLVRGASNAAGEMGFLPFGADPFEPESLRSGAFERVVATHGMIERYAALAGKQRRRAGDFRERAARGEPEAACGRWTKRRAISRAASRRSRPSPIPKRSSWAARSGCGPEILIAGEGRCCRTASPIPIDVEASELGPRAAIIGAAAIGLGQLHNTLFGVDAPDGRISLPPAQFGALREAAL